ncbi:MAG: helix-turn-helix transcriptional regulator [Prevotellaceae bacterium]|nr:helix-turn-helix transcriptional regulator [Prevotellaceae bacterium]
MTDYFEFSTPEIVRILGSRFREYRMRCNLTQSEAAERAGVAKSTLQKFESGNACNMSITTLILLLKVVGRINALEELLPELPESPYLIRNEKKVQRIRHKKDE